MAQFCWYSCIYTRDYADLTLSAGGYAFFHASQTQLCYQSFPCGLKVRSREEDVGLRVGVWCCGCAAPSGMVPASPAPPAQHTWICRLPPKCDYSSWTVKLLAVWSCQTPSILPKVKNLVLINHPTHRLFCAKLLYLSCSNVWAWNHVITGKTRQDLQRA